MKDLSESHIPLADRYEFIREYVQIEDIEFKIHRIKDTDRLLDELIEKGEAHEDVQDERIPYWADLWPSAIAMGIYLRKHAHLVEGKKVLEIGCGIGLSAMVAKSCGGEVILSDYLVDALELATYNWKENFGEIPTCLQLDWRNPSPQHATEVLLAADVAYEERAFEPLLKAFPVLLQENSCLILSEPGRPIAHKFLASLENLGFSYQKEIIQIPYRNVLTAVNIYLLKKT